MTIKYLVQRENREYFFDEVPEWASESPDYKVTKLSSTVSTETVQKAIEDVQILQELYALEEEEISSMKHKLEEAVELVENIHLFASNQTTNIIEARGLLKLIAENCLTWLKPKE